MNNRYDVVVVGGGPAGSMAAMYAAKGGASTFLAEKHPVIGQPLSCAEAISKSGLHNVIAPREEWIASRVHRARLFSPDGKAAQIIHPEAGYVLNRTLFDQDLSDMAAKAGADIQVGVDIRDVIFKGGKLTGVIAQTNGISHEIEAKVIIAADGIESMIARKAGLNSHLQPRQIHSACQYLLDDIDIEPETIEFHFGNTIAPGGYIWVFPKGENKANVGLGVCPTKSPRKKALEFLNEFVESRFKHYTIVERYTGGVPSHLPGLPLYKDNFLLVGDAARVIDSLTGAGIANALLSGKIAGKTAVRMVNEQISGEAYANEFNEIKRKEIKFYYHCREIFLKLTDSDFNSIIAFTEEMFGDRDVTAINPFDVVTKILLAHPRLLKLGRHLIF